MKLVLDANGRLNFRMGAVPGALLLVSMMLSCASNSCAQSPDGVYQMAHPGTTIGMPNRLLRYGYLAWGSMMMNCNGWLARRYKRRGRIMDYPACDYGGRGLVNRMPTMSAHDMIYGS